jgi:hypothetical protein
MSRTVTTLLDSRADAEAVRTRFIAQVNTESIRIMAMDTTAAVDSLDLDPKHAKTYQDAMREGGHLLVAEVAAGQDPKKIIAVIEQAVGSGTIAAEASAPDTPAFKLAGMTDVAPAEPAIPQPAVGPRAGGSEGAAATVATPKEVPAPAPVLGSAVQYAPGPQDDCEMRIGAPLKARGGARVRSVIRDTPAEEQIMLSDEHVDVEHRPSARQLSFEDVQAGGLLKERVFEIREMREEPVVTKETFVREEVIVRKVVQERIETVRDTVRRTDFEIEESPAQAPRLARRREARPGSR